MPTRVQLPNGSVGEFPDGMSQQQIEAVLQKQFPAEKTPPPNTVTGGAVRRTGDILKGLKQTFGPPKTPLEYLAGPATPLLRMGEGAVESGITAGKQAIQQAKEAHAIPAGNKAVKALQYGRAVTTGLSALDPFASGTVTNINKLEDEGRGREAVGQALPDLALLTAPEAGRAVGKVLPKVARAVAKTGPNVAGDLVKETQATNAAGDAFSKTRSAIETARERALDVGNEKYNGVNEKLNPIRADMEKVHGMYYEAAESFGEAQAQPALINRLGTALKNGAELTYKDEQALYSDLGKELSKGSLPGNVYHAYDVLHEGIGNDMQRIADSQGQGAELTAARNYWRRMKQTFGKPLPQGDAATSTLHTLAPELAEADTIGNRMRMLGSFNPEIPRAFEEMNKARAKAKGTEPATPGVDKKIGAQDIRERKLKSLTEEGIPRVRKVGHRIVNYGVGLKALWNAFGGRIADVPGDIGLGVAGYGATEAFARLLERPDIQEMLTKPTPADIAKIPPELRGNLGPMLQAAAAKGIKVSPALLGAGGAAAIAGQRKGVASALQP